MDSMETIFLYKPISTSFEVPKKTVFITIANTFQIVYLAEAPHSENFVWANYSEPTVMWILPNAGDFHQGNPQPKSTDHSAVGISLSMTEQN